MNYKFIFTTISLIGFLFFISSLAATESVLSDNISPIVSTQNQDTCNLPNDPGAVEIGVCGLTLVANIATSATGFLTSGVGWFVLIFGFPIAAFLLYVVFTHWKPWGAG